MENNKQSKTLIASSIIWKFFERIGAQGIGFIVSLIIARILSPSEYGSLAIINVLINLGNVFIQTGFNTALVQKKEVDADDYSSIFTISLLISIIFFILIYFLAPTIGLLYDDVNLVNPLRIISINLVIGSLVSIYSAYVSRNFLFKKTSFISMIATVISGAVGIALAYLGYGIWALVFQQICYQASNCILLVLTIRLRFKLRFTFKRCRGLLPYGTKILLSNLITTAFVESRSVIIGIKYDTEKLGFFSRGRQFPDVVCSNLNSSMQVVMLSAYSRYQNDKDAIKSMMHKSVGYTTYLIMPIMLCLIVIAQPLIKLLLTDKWLPAVPFLQLNCIIYASFPIQTTVVQAIKGIGASGTILRLEIIKKVFEVIILIITVPLGLEFILYGEIICTVFSLLVNVFSSRKLIGYSFIDMFKDLWQPIFLSLVSAGLAYLLSLILWDYVLIMFLQVVLFFVVYFIMSVLVKNKILLELWGKARLKFRKNKIKNNKEENMKKVMLVFGTRPEAIKMCPLVNELKTRKSIQTIVCVTGQHRQMLDQVLETFNVVPDYDLSIMKSKQTLFDITTNILNRIGQVLDDAQPDVVLVHGDTSTTFVTALACFYKQIPVGHVEAGLRTYNIYSPYPEEFNRQAVGIVAKFNFTPTELSKANLLKEGKNPESIFVTGNTAIDALKTTVKENYSHPELEWANGSRLIVITAHRRENLGEPMRNMFRAIRKIMDEHPDVKTIYPIHMNPVVRQTANEIFGDCDRIHIIEPLDVLDFHNFLSRSYLILTDSGGIQEEAPSLGKPVLVMRDTTERPEGIKAGTLKLVGTDEQVIYENFKLLLEDKTIYDKMAKASNPYGDGFACKRIADVLEV